MFTKLDTFVLGQLWELFPNHVVLVPVTIVFFYIERIMVSMGPTQAPGVDISHPQIVYIFSNKVLQ